MFHLGKTLGIAACLSVGVCQYVSSAEPPRGPVFQPGPAPILQQPPAYSAPAYPAQRATYEAPLANTDQRVAPGPIPLAASASRKEPALPLKPPGQNSAATKASGFSAVATTLGSLAAVLALFLGVTWFMRRGLPAGTMLLPSEVVEVLGRAPLAGRQQMQLIRCGNKLLLVCLSVGGAETLTEITEPAEVDRLAGLCREAHPQSATAAFRHVFQQFGRERTTKGFLGSTADDHAEPAPARVSNAASRRLRQEDDDV